MEEKVKNPEKLYVEFDIPKTIHEFLKKFFFDRVKFREEFIYRNAVSYPTFFDKECKELQCNSCKIRSFDDLMILVNTYFPNTNSKELMLEILNLNSKEKEHYTVFYYCNDIKKSTLYFHGIPFAKIIGQREYLKNTEYVWEELFELVGIDWKQNLANNILEFNKNGKK